MTLLQIYELIVNSVGVNVDVGGALTLDGNPVYINTDDGKLPLYMPTKEILSKGDWDKLAAFHPMCEYVYSGQSEVLNTLSELVSLCMCDAVLRSAASIVALAGNTSEHNKLRIKQTELISKYEVTKVLVNAMMSIATKHTGISGKYPLLSVRLDRGGVVDDETYSRTCVIVPHVLNNMTVTKGGVTLMGAVISNNAALTVQDIFTRVLPKKLMYGNNNANTPYLFALLETYYHFASHINSLTEILGNYTTVKIIDTSWYEHLPEMKKLQKAQLPQVLPYNRGVSLVAEEKPKVGSELDDDQDDPMPAQTASTNALEEAISGNANARNISSLGLNKLGRARPKDTTTAPPPTEPRRLTINRDRDDDYDDRDYRRSSRSGRERPLTISEKLAMEVRDDRPRSRGNRSRSDDVYDDRDRGFYIPRRGGRSNR